MFFRIVLGAVLAAAAVGLGFAAYQGYTWPAVSELATINPSSTAFIDDYREQQRQAGDEDQVEWLWVPDSAISVHVKRAVVAAEDMEFFSHGGISTFEIREAVREAVQEGEKLRGASTITQQLAKNLWLSPSRNPWRKVKELILTRQLEKHLDKHRILELYLNVVEFGRGIYGVEAAATHYFGTAAAELTEREAAMLAASLPRPSSWNPRSSSSAYEQYVATIRSRMDRATFLQRHIRGPDPLPSTQPVPTSPMDGQPWLQDDSLLRDTTTSERIYRRPADRIPKRDSSWTG